MGDRPELGEEAQFIVSEGGEKKRDNPLLSPEKYDLEVLLAELKWGRPAADQEWLDEKIAELRGERAHG